MTHNRTLLVIAIIAVVAAIIATGIVYFSIAHLTSTLSGFATGETNLSIESAAQINFTDDSINFGSGRVDDGESAAFLDTTTGTVTNGNFSADSTGLRLENIGNLNVSLNISGTQTAATFFGGTSPGYQWNVSAVEANSCLNVTGTGTAGMPETSAFEQFANVNTSVAAEFCPVFQFVDTADLLRIDFNLTVPSDSITGARGDVITATAVAL